MKRSFKNHSIAFVCTSSVLLGCGTQPPQVAATSPTPAASPAASEATPVPSATNTPSATVAVSDTQTYKEAGMAISAKYPKNMTVESSCSGEGCGYFFKFKPQGNALDEAEVHVFLPAGAASTNDLMPMITGPNGLIKSNGWTLNGSRADGVKEFPYSWLETVFDFSTDKEQSGHILIGQTNGQAVQVTLLYPAEMAKAYWPVAKTILDSLEFDPSLLPIKSSEKP